MARLLLTGTEAPRQVVLEATTAGLVEPALARSESDVLSALENEPLVPVPEVFDAINTHPEPYILMAVNHGQNFEGIGGTIDLTLQRAFLRQSGPILARVHDRWNFGAHGPLGVTDGKLEPVATGASDPHENFCTWLRKT